MIGSPHVDSYVYRASDIWLSQWLGCGAQARHRLLQLPLLLLAYATPLTARRCVNPLLPLRARARARGREEEG